MIIKKLALHNFRVFRGAHEIDLEPSCSTYKRKPIVLLGGLNGSGKTSILTAIRLALYGKLAFENINQPQEYIQQLSELIHKGSSAQQLNDALIELTFTYNKDGEESEFTVVRSWERNKSDRLALHQNGKHLSELNYDQCQGFLNELIPHGIADLFFFDGEKIASLAEDESGDVLRTAVRRLLGLDLIAKLRSDLTIYLKRQNSQELDTFHKESLKTIEAERLRLANSVENFRYAADLAKIHIDLISSDIRKQEGVLATQGGAFALSKKQEQIRVDELLKEKILVEKNIRHEFEGTLPYALAPNTMNNLLRQLENESRTKQAQSFSKELRSFLNSFNDEINLAPQSNVDLAKSLLETQLKNYLSSRHQEEVILDVSERESGMIYQAIRSESKKAGARFDEARVRLNQIERSIEEAASNIDRAPDEQQLSELFSTIRSLDTKRIEAYTEYKSLLNNAKQAMTQQLEHTRQIQKIHDKERLTHGSSTAVTHAKNTLDMLSTYADKLTLARVKKLEVNFSDAYSRLARKDDLKITARIDPDTFDVALIDNQSNSISRKSLSAGEKQIYAIAILEALAKTSGRQLPVIIDTPLGRLDSHHREKIIDNYFTSASHQVVILSTDTEINEHYFLEKLTPYISHAYQIQFDTTTKSANITPGYFWSKLEVNI